MSCEYINNEILLSLKKEKDLVIYNNRGEPGGHCAYETSQTWDEKNCMISLVHRLYTLDTQKERVAGGYQGLGRWRQWRDIGQGHKVAVT